MPIDMNLLLVEDNELDAQILQRGLKKISAEGSLVRARDGMDALEILTRDVTERTLPQPFLILLDINMPRMNGHEFLEALRTTEEIKDARVFVFTTSDSENDIARAYEHNANGYIVKPASMSELQEVLSFLQKFWEVCEHPCVKAA